MDKPEKLVDEDGDVDYNPDELDMELGNEGPVHEMFQEPRLKWYQHKLITKRNIILLVGGAIIIILLALLAGGLIVYGFEGSNEQTVCRKYKEDVEEVVVKHKGTTVIKNVYVIQGDGEPVSQGKVDILIKDGLIDQVGPGLTGDEVITTYDGYIVTPGLVDMHSHVGVYSFWEGIAAHRDGNELTNPAMPQVRAIDAFNPDDLAIKDVRRGGVTTIQVLPGSGNVMGGEAAFFKLRGGLQSVEAMRIRNAPRAMKMACGENPKRVYGKRLQTPMSRMGSAWVMRQKFEAAAKLMHAQNDWDCESTNQNAALHKRPSDLSLESLVRLLRNETVLNVHCYEVEDLEMMIRLSKEFNFKIAAFHHGLNAYKIGGEIVEQGITVSTFGDLFGYKMEAYDASVHAPKILTQSGVPVAMKSDHPVSHAKDLITHAAKAAFYGWDPKLALASVMSVPAKAIRMDHRIGFLKSGYEGDFVVWDRHPLDLGARPRAVYIEGTLVHDEPTKTLVSNELNPKYTNAEFNHPFENSKQSLASNYVVKGLKEIYDGDNLRTATAGNPLMIVVTNGTIACIGSSCSYSSSHKEINYPNNDGIATPGFIEATSQVGIVNIGAEDATNDGYATESQQDVYAMNGLKLQTRTAKAAYLGGVSMSISHPHGSYLVAGHVSGFFTGYDYVHPDEFQNSTVYNSLGLFVNFGDDAKHTGLDRSISGQASHLRSVILSNSDIKSGRTPLIVHVYDDEEIMTLLRLKKEFHSMKLILVGAARAFKIADELKEADVSVIVTPTEEDYVAEQQFQTRESNDIFYADVLKKAGVRVGFGMGTVYNVRNLRWQAGMGREWSSESNTFQSTEDAVESISSVIADMFNLEDGLGRIKEGTRTNFNLFSGDPLSYEGKLQAVAYANTILCNPVQF